MNYLAHCLLSGRSEKILVGNFIGDAVKGNNLKIYEDEIHQGILLHRSIDDFTDHHPITEKSKKRLRPEFGKFSGVIADVFYDHFLAAEFKKYSEFKNLEIFADWVYKIIQKNWNILPDRSRMMLPYMIRGNWLVNYSKIEGINRALTGMAHRSSFDSGMENASKELEKNYSKYKKEFELFFPELKEKFGIK